MSPTTETTRVPASSSWLEAWHVSPSSNPDYNLVDGLRGIAILLVLVCHFLYVNPNATPVIRFIGGIFGAGSNGVPLFFCISGFLISLPFWYRKAKGAASPAPRGYGWRRFWKIYPPLAATVLIFTPFYFLFEGDGRIFATALQWLSGVSFFVPPSGKLNPVMWSLVVEVQFYILIPLAFLCLKRVSIQKSLWIMTGVLLVLPTLSRYAFYQGCGPVFFPRVSSNFPSGLDNFALGILLAGLESIKRTRKSWAKAGNVGFVLLLAALLMGGWSALHPFSELMREVLRTDVILAAGLLLCYIADPQYAVSKWLCAAPLRWFGLISYELYLVHQPIFVWMRGYVGSCGGSFPKYLALQSVGLGVSIFLSALLYKRFSLPILRAKRKVHSSS